MRIRFAGCLTATSVRIHRTGSQTAFQRAGRETSSMCSHMGFLWSLFSINLMRYCSISAYLHRQCIPFGPDEGCLKQKSLQTAAKQGQRNRNTYIERNQATGSTSEISEACIPGLARHTHGTIACGRGRRRRACVSQYCSHPWYRLQPELGTLRGDSQVLS